MRGNREEMLDCLLDTDFGKQWNDEVGKIFRKKVVDLLGDNFIAWIPEPYEKKEEKLEEVQLGKIVNIAGDDWIPLEHFANGGTLCMRKDIWSQKAFDENNSNNWKISSLREKLNTDFLIELVNQLKEHGLSTELIKIEQDLTTNDGLKDYGSSTDKVTLLTCEQYRIYRHLFDKIGKWWWLITADSTINNSVQFVNADGSLNYYNAYFGNVGVRPVCMFPSSIRVTE